MHLFDQGEISLARDQSSTRIFQSCKISCHCADEFGPVEAPQCDEQIFEIEHIFPNVFCIMVGVLQIPVTKRLLTSSLADWNMYLMHSNLKDNMVSVQDDDSKDKAEATGFPVWIISLDLSKAFDRVH